MSISVTPKTVKILIYKSEYDYHRIMKFLKNKKILILLITSLSILITGVVLFISAYKSVESYNNDILEKINDENSKSLVKTRMTDKNTMAKMIGGPIFFLKNRPVHFFRNFESNVHDPVLIDSFKTEKCQITKDLENALSFYYQSDQKVFEPVIISDKNLDIMADASWLAQMGFFFWSEHEMAKYQAFYQSINELTFKKNVDFMTIFYFPTDKSVQLINIGIIDNNTRLHIQKGRPHTFEGSAYNAVAYFISNCGSDLTEDEKKEIKSITAG